MFLLALLGCTISHKSFDELAGARDISGLKSRATAALAVTNAFAFLRTNGTYETGRFGWHAIEFSNLSGAKKYVVFTTPLTSEDTGEQLFEVAGGVLSKYIPETESFGFKIVRNNLDVKFSLPKTVNVSDEVLFTRLSQPLSEFMFRISPIYRISSVTDARGRKIRFKQAGGIVCLAAPKESQFRYTVAYSGTPDKPRFAGSISNNEAFLTNDYWWPMIARGPAPYTLTVRTPLAWTAVGQGERLSVSTLRGEKITKYKMDVPVNVYSLSASNYNSRAKVIDGRRFTIWGKDVTQAQADDQAEFYSPILKFYEKFAPFPFSGYGALLEPVYGAGALEAYSFATYGGSDIPGDDAHEPAHTWWGGFLPNTYLRSLWNESFAVYSDGLYNREGAPGDRQARRLAFISMAEADDAYNTATIANSPSQIGPAASALGYGKGAAVLQMLEAELGTAAMIDSMRGFLRRHKSVDAANWEDFEKAVDETMGRSYKWFFDQWLRRRGYPDFDIADVAWSAGKVRGKVAFRGDAYKINCEVMIEYPDGKRVFDRFNTMQTKVGPNTYSFVIESAQKPALVSIDPWRRVLRRQNANERPLDIEQAIGAFRKFTDPAHKDWMTNAGRDSLNNLPDDLSSVFIVGSPETIPQMKALCEKAGFVVQGNLLTYKSKTIDLRKGAALALVTFAPGKKCLIGLGRTRFSPNTGTSQVSVVDDFGRFITGETSPKTEGQWTFRF